MNPELIAYLLTWAVFYTDYPAPDVQPVIEYKPHSYFVREMCDFVDNLEKPCNVRAMYNDDIDGVLFLDEGFEGQQNAYVKGIVVHEMVHYLQDLSGDWKNIRKWQRDIRCQEKAYRQREAYMVQDKYMFDVHGTRRSSPRFYSPCGKF